VKFNDIYCNKGFDWVPGMAEVRLKLGNNVVEQQLGQQGVHKPTQLHPVA
jgi:hypothetical protein